MRFFAAVLVGVAAVLAPSPTMAQQTPQQSEADRLFQEGRALLEAGKSEEACAKFEQSIAKDPRAIGVLMNLGLCNARSGKIATAMKLFQEAHDRASEAGLERAREQAQDEITKLAPKVPTITLARAAPALPGEKLVVDDQVISLERTELRLDPGSHTLVVTAPGRLPHQQRFEVVMSDRKTIEIPALRVPENKVVTRTRSTRRTVGKFATFGGAAIALAGGGLAFYAKRDYDKLFEGPNPRCGVFPDIGGKPTCDAAGQSRTERDRNLGVAATVVTAVGLTAAATGLVLWLTAPDDESRTTVVPTGSATSVGLAVSGRF